MLRITDLGEPGFDVLVEAIGVPPLRDALHGGGRGRVDAATAETLRIEGGVPEFHRDMDEETIPLEAGIESRAISLTKGCYVGQEVIIRVLHRGHGRVARKLVGLACRRRGRAAAGRDRAGRRARGRRGDERRRVAGAAAGRSRWPTCSATSSHQARR